MMKLHEPVPAPTPPLPDRAEVARRGFPTDRLLRSLGFRVAARPAAGPVLWRRGGETLTEAEAVRVVFAGGPDEGGCRGA